MMEGGSIKGGERRRRPRADARAPFPADDFPVLRDVGRYFAECPADEQFEFGLDLMIRGLLARVAAGPDADCEVDAFLADAVQASGGKLHALGIGWRSCGSAGSPRGTTGSGSA